MEEDLDAVSNPDQVKIERSMIIILKVIMKKVRDKTGLKYHEKNLHLLKYKKFLMRVLTKKVRQTR